MPESNLPPQQPPEDSSFYETNSLSDYIARHLREKDLPLPKKMPESRKNFIGSQEKAYNKLHSPEYGNKGMFLHHYDTQLVNGHLERFLPTPSTRFQLSRERLHNELRRIYEDLHQFHQLNGEEYKARIEALEQRANLIQRKILDLDLKLADINPFQSMYKNIKKLTDRPKHENKKWTFNIQINRNRTRKERNKF